MSIERQMEKEEQYLEDELESGSISLNEYNDAMRELERDYRGAAEESAQRAYDDELRNW